MTPPSASPAQQALHGPAVPHTAAAPFDAAGFGRTFAHRVAVEADMRTHYVVGGEGPAVVLLHGFPMTWYYWRKVMPALAAAGHTVIAPDLRGLGDSSRPPGGFDARTAAEDIHRLVRRLGLQQVRLVGHDIGAQVAYAYAAAHPEEVQQLVYMDEALPGFGHERLMDNSAGLGTWHLNFNVGDDLAEALLHGRERAYIATLYREFLFDHGAVTSADLDVYVRAYAQPGAMRAGLGYYRAVFATARQNRELAAAGPLRMPVLAIAARHGVGPAAIDSLRPVAADLTAQVFEDCGHFIAEERPEDLVGSLLAFFRQGQSHTGAADVPLPPPTPERPSAMPDENAPLTVIARFRAKPDAEAETERLLRSMLAPTRAEPGNLAYDLHRAEGAPGEFTLVERWAGEAALEEHKRTPHFRRLEEASRTLLTEPMSLALLHPLEDAR